MDLWIRSQNKKGLIKVENLTITSSFVNNEKEIFYIINNSINNKCSLGHYETEERALEILNEIHQILASINSNCVVYNMPEK